MAFSVTGGLQGSEGSKEVRPALPREHRVQCGHRGGAGLGGSKDAQAGRRPPPHVLCGGTGTQGVRREGRRAPCGQQESLREVEQGGDSQVCILEKYFDVSGEQTRVGVGGRTVREPVCLSALAPPLPRCGVGGEGEAGGELIPGRRESDTPKARFPGECSPQAPRVTRTRITPNPGSLAP